MSPIDWYQRGKHDFAEGVPRSGAPSSEEATAGREWRRGWDEAASKARKRRPDLSSVELLMRDGRLYLVDESGRVLGNQTNLVLEQGEDGTAASVTFAGLRIRTLP